MYYIPYQITSSLSFKMIISFISITTCSWFTVIRIYIMSCHVQVIILILLTLTLSSYHIHSITFISHIFITVKHSYMPYHSIYHYHVHNYQHETLSVFSTWYCLLRLSAYCAILPQSFILSALAQRVFPLGVTAILPVSNWCGKIHIPLD